MNIVVLCGGLSTERDVSISSGTGVASALRARGHCVLLIDLFLGFPDPQPTAQALFADPPALADFSVGEAEPDLDKVRAMRPDSRSRIGPRVLELCQAADICFLALHGEEGENGKLQALFDLLGVRYTGCGYLGSALAMNKSLSKTLFQAHGIPTPKSITLQRGQPLTSFTFPCVVKPCSGGSSVGTSIVESAEGFEQAVELAFTYEEQVLVEQYIRGRELTVGILDGEAMPVVEIIPKSGFYDYKNKYQAGATLEICPAEIGAETTRKVQALACEVYKVLGLQAYGRVDFLWEQETGVLYCLEANTLPGMTPTSLIPRMAVAMGMDYADLCEKILQVSQKKYA